MIDLQQLKQLSAIAEKGTLSAAAKELHISQPALTRSMQRLEQTLSIDLFDRKKNRTSLNEVGLLAVELAKGILHDVEEFPRQLQALARSLNTISIGSCAPAPMWNLASELMELYPEYAVNSEMKSGGELLDGLFAGNYHLIITDRPIEQAGVFSRVFAKEQLTLSVPFDHPLSSRSSVRLSDLEGQTMLLYHDLGIWDRVIEKLESLHVHFIVQRERDVFEDLIISSNIPCFDSNMIHHPLTYGVHRTAIPILDDEAVAVYYINSTTQGKALLDRLTFRGQNQ